MVTVLLLSLQGCGGDAPSEDLSTPETDPPPPLSSPPGEVDTPSDDGTLTTVSSGYTHTCGLRADETAVWCVAPGD